MAREWSSVCIDCGNEFSFSDSTYQRALNLGQCLPAMCTPCQAEFARERKTLARIERALSAQSLPPQQIIGSLGEVSSVYRSASMPSEVDKHRANFGVSDQRLIEFYQKLDDPAVQVVLVEAPTGAGKSTFFPYRLLSPPPGVPDPEIFTRNGQIVVTQPRVQATIGIPDFVKKLHGCTLGAGFDVGRKWSKENASDWNCKLVYLTDGTLVNLSLIHI